MTVINTKTEGDKAKSKTWVMYKTSIIFIYNTNSNTITTRVVSICITNIHLIGWNLPKREQAHWGHHRVIMNN